MFSSKAFAYGIDGCKSLLRTKPDVNLAIMDSGKAVEPHKVHTSTCAPGCFKGNMNSAQRGSGGAIAYTWTHISGRCIGIGDDPLLFNRECTLTSFF